VGKCHCTAVVAFSHVMRTDKLNTEVELHKPVQFRFSLVVYPFAARCTQVQPLDVAQVGAICH
jgi:hypothetical protein